MKRHILIIATVIFSITLNACTINVDGETFGGKTIKGDGNVVTRNYDVSAFDAISISLPATVNFTTSDEYSCVVHVDENILEYLEIKVKKGELLMSKPDKYKDITILKPTEFIIEVTAPTLYNINLAGSGKFNVLSPLQGEELEVNVAGSGDVILNKTVSFQEIGMNVAGSGSLVCIELVADKLNGSIAGSGDLKVAKGEVRKAIASVAGSGDIILSCDIDHLEADIAGSGDIKARVSGKLKYGIIGSGDISYYGNPVVEGDKVGSGNVKQISE
jgi:hypothetical protein